MTKQQIFSPYLANERQEIYYDGEKMNGWLCAIVPEETEEGIVNTCTTDGMESFVNISDCQLVLKPIAEMSRDEHWDCFGKAIDTPDRYSIDEIEYLITHGYALDDTWFTNGIAIKESKHE